MLKTIFSYLSYPFQKATPIEPITLSGKFYIYDSYLSSYTLSFSHSTFTLSPSFISVSSPNISVHSFPTSISLISFTSTSNSKCLFWEFDGNYYLFVFNLKNDLSFPGLHITKSKKVYYIDSIIPLELLNSSMNNNDDENIVYSSQPGDLLEFDKSTDKFFLHIRNTFGQLSLLPMSGRKPDGMQSFICRQSQQSIRPCMRLPTLMAQVDGRGSNM